MNKLNQIAKLDDKLSNDWILNFAKEKLKPINEKETLARAEHDKQNPNAGFFAYLEFEPLTENERQTSDRLLKIISLRTNKILEKRNKIIDSLNSCENEVFISIG